MALFAYFAEWKRNVVRLTPRSLSHCIPGDNMLVVWWEQAQSPEWVVAQIKLQAASFADSPV